ncbi:FAD:protein FMN transferase [Aggregatimonas sangjinii]|uniref:FAD:protein FMN transferase n=1 Tax=Aggregatimonas sangjinii TaxID=2583587 RepID=A0A5B7SKX0_9FLAO|nr:FAD:protein FMN transferase [Aggregatimonas sangjinii]QCW99126.1 FAD:protein FMN transferase [Aggregatimonas sangjinii]
MKKFIFIIIGCLLCSCGSSEPKIVQNQLVGAALGTSYNIIYLSDKELDYQKEIDSVFAAINQSMSTYIPDSDIAKINAGDTTVVVDAMFEEVFTLSKDIHTKTKGYFDPTVGVLVNAWGFGPGKQLKMDSVRVDSLMHYVGFDKVKLTPGKTIIKENVNVHFDFNAIAKGYAIDRLAKMLDTKGIQNYLLEVGGELVAKGENTIKQKPWSVGIDDPQITLGRKSKLLISLKDRALASSGNYRKFRVDSVTGKRYVHTIDPKTGFTKGGNTLAANVLASDCATADAYATAFMAMDLDETLKFLAKQEALDAYIIYLDQKAQTREYMTKGFKELVNK